MPRETPSQAVRLNRLRESEIRFRGLSALSADSYWEQDDQFRFVSFSGAQGDGFESRCAERLLGTKRWESEYLNMTEADWAAHRTLLEARKPFRDLELCRYDASGRKYWTRVSGEPVFDASGTFKGYRGIARDFTERRRAEELRELEHAVTRILAEADSASTGLRAVFRAVCETEGWECGRYFRLDEQAGVLRFADAWSIPDPAVERWVELSRGRAYRPGDGLSGLAWQTGQHLWSTDVTKDPRAGSGSSKFPPQGIGIHGTFVFPVVLGGKTLGVISFACRKAREPEEQLVQAISAIGGQIGQFLQRRQADEQRRLLEVQLREAQKLQAIGTLATGMAHEFNNTLRAILAHAALARMDLSHDHSARVSIEEIDKAGLRAREFVQSILAFARPHAPERQRVQLADIVQEAVRLVRATLPRGIELAVEPGRDMPAVLADAAQIHQVLVNLCTNAWQAMEGASGRIVIGLSGVVLSPSEARRMPGLGPGRFARLSVSDAGPGIDPAILERIFDPFFTTKPASQGTGLGLSVVHGIVRAHEGAIEVESEPGKGATFYVYFPEARRDTERGLADEGLDPAPGGGGRHVFFLDDNQELVSAVVRTLSRQGYRVTGHTVPELALAAVQADPRACDVFVSDYKMPRLSGLDVALELSRTRPDLPVILISGYVDDELQRKARAVGVRRVLSKLNPLDELVDAIDKLIGASAAPRRRP
jgi:PAS domain S-box-containing protein